MSEKIVLKEYDVYATINECSNNKFQLIIYPYYYPSCWLFEGMFKSRADTSKFIEFNKQFYINEWERINSNSFYRIKFECEEIKELYK